MVTAELKNYRQSPRKVRIVVDLVRGKKVGDALNILTFTVKKASLPIVKLIESAVANAKHNFNLDKENLFIKEIRVDEGPTMKRHMPRAHGRAFEIKKRTSRVKIVLAEKNPSKSKSETAEIAVEAEKTEESVKTVKKTSKKPAKEVKAVKKDNK